MEGVLNKNITQHDATFILKYISTNIGLEFLGDCVEWVAAKACRRSWPYSEGRQELGKGRRAGTCVTSAGSSLRHCSTQLLISPLLEQKYKFTAYNSGFKFMSHRCTRREVFLHVNYYALSQEWRGTCQDQQWPSSGKGYNLWYN